MCKKVKTFYLCAAGGKGNIGAEATMLAIIQILQKRYSNTRFIISSWYLPRISKLISQTDGDFIFIRKESIFANPLDLIKSHFFIVCGDIPVNEKLILFFPLYFSIRSMIARVFRNKVVLLGTGANRINHPLNLFAVKHILTRSINYFIARDEISLNNLKELSFGESRLLAGSETCLLLDKETLPGYAYNNPHISDTKLLVGFAVRDLFDGPFILNILTRKLKRRDADYGEITAKMAKIIDFMAMIADYLTEKHNAQLLFIPHHYLPVEEKVILNDEDIAALIINRMNSAADTIILDSELHPFTLMNIYRRFDLVFSMRHHASSFSCFHGIPNFGIASDKKILNFYGHIDKKEFILDPLKYDKDKIFANIETVLCNKKHVSEGFKNSIRSLQSTMATSLDTVFKDT